MTQVKDDCDLCDADYWERLKNFQDQLFSSRTYTVELSILAHQQAVGEMLSEIHYILMKAKKEGKL